MPKHTGPLFSLSASGTLAKTITFRATQAGPQSNQWHKHAQSKSFNALNWQSGMRRGAHTWQSLAGFAAIAFAAMTLADIRSGYAQWLHTNICALRDDPDTCEIWAAPYNPAMPLQGAIDLQITGLTLHWHATLLNNTPPNTPLYGYIFAYSPPTTGPNPKPDELITQQALDPTTPQTLTLPHSGTWQIATAVMYRTPKGKLQPGDRTQNTIHVP